MRNRLVVLTGALSLAFALSAGAAGRQSLIVDLQDGTILAGTKITPGQYKISWTTDGAESSVTLTQGRKVVVTARGKLVERPRPADHDELVAHKDPSGALVVSEVRLRGEKKALVLSAS